jgi:rhamnosyl/mannosyltransferase
MKILHVYKDYYPILGGIENHVKTLAEAETAANHDVTVLVTEPGGQLGYEEINGVHVWRVRRLATVASTPLTLAMPFKLRQLQPDITHLHFPYPIGEISQWLAGRRRPYIVTYHSDVVKQQRILRFYRPLLQRVLQGAARILPTSDNYVRS